MSLKHIQIDPEINGNDWRRRMIEYTEEIRFWSELGNEKYRKRDEVKSIRTKLKKEISG